LSFSREVKVGTCNIEEMLTLIQKTSTRRRGKLTRQKKSRMKDDGKLGEERGTTILGVVS